jgi:hypothetical protein
LPLKSGILGCQPDEHGKTSTENVTLSGAEAAGDQDDFAVQPIAKAIIG